MAIVGLWVQNGLFGTPYGLKLGSQQAWFRNGSIVDDDSTALERESFCFCPGRTAQKPEVHRLQRVRERARSAKTCIRL